MATTTARTLKFTGFTPDEKAVTFVEHLTVDDGSEAGATRGVAMVELDADQWREMGAPPAVTITVKAATSKA